MVFVPHRCYAAERRKELIPFATAWMKLESIMLSEISQDRFFKDIRGNNKY